MSRLVGTAAAVLVWASGAMAQEPIVLTPPGLDDIPPPPPAVVDPPPAAPADIFTAPAPVDVPAPRLRPQRETADIDRSLEPLGAVDLPTLPSSGFEPLPGTASEIGSGEDSQPAGASEEARDLAVAEPLPPPGGPDRAYGAFQRGLYLTAFDIAIPLAENGDTAAQTLIGLIYEGGYGVPQSLPDALSWYQIAANAGDREAQFALGLMYLEGRGVERDRAKAADIFEQAARQGQIDAMYNLGLFHLEGTVRPLDPEVAAAYLSRAAEAGNPDAQYAIAQIYAQGLGVEVDDAAAARWLGSAARLGVIPAQVEYAIRLANGKGIAKDESSAVRWLERAANAGDPIAQNRLARMLAIGAGKPASPVEAAKWHYLAASAGKNDDWLDSFVNGLTDAQKQAAVAAAQRWPGD